MELVCFVYNPSKRIYTYRYCIVNILKLDRHTSFIQKQRIEENTFDYNLTSKQLAMAYHYANKKWVK